MQNKVGQPQVKPQARTHVYEGISVDTVRKNGSDGQKLAVNLFDTDNNGVLDKREAALMNSCNFKAEKGKLTIFRHNNDGSKATIEMKYNVDEEVFVAASRIAQTDKGLILELMGHNNEGKDIGVFGAHISKYENISIDCSTGKVNVKGAEGNLYSDRLNLTVLDSDIESIDTNNGRVKLKNVKDETFFGYSATKVNTNGQTVIEPPVNSKVEVKKDEPKISLWRQFSNKIKNIL